MLESSNVLLPTLLNVDTTRRKHVLARAIGLLAMATFPMAIGLAAVAHTLVDVLLPDRWQGVAPFLVILAAVSLFRPVNGMISQYLLSVERNRALMVAEVVRIATLFLGLVALAAFGPYVAAFAVGISAFAHTCSLLYAIHGDGSFLKALTAGLRAPLAACAVMVLAIAGIHSLVGPVDAYQEAVLLVAEILGGGLAYVAGMFVFGRAAALEAISMTRGALGARGA